MRLFVAIEPPRDVLADIGFTTSRDDVRVPTIDRMHLTLAFYGDVSEARVDELNTRLARAAGRYPKVQLQFRGAGTFPKQAHRARVLWLGVSGMTTDLSKLADSCAAAGRRVGTDVGDRKFRAHLTLARAKPRFGADLSAEVDALSSYEGPVWTADYVALVRSHLGPNPRYEAIAEFGLQADS